MYYARLTPSVQPGVMKQLRYPRNKTPIINRTAPQASNESRRSFPTQIPLYDSQKTNFFRGIIGQHLCSVPSPDPSHASIPVP